MPWLVMAKYVAMLGLLVAVGLWQRHDGALSERVVWETRLAEENANAAKLIQAAEESARQKEHDSAQQIQSISADYQRKLAYEKTKYKSVDVAVANNDFRLLDRDAAAVCPNNSGTAEAAAPSSGSDGAEGCKLSANVTRSLWFLATNADDIVEQLTACQAVVEADRK
jgi:prophage endopeptidase